MPDFKTALNASTLFPFQLDVIEQVSVAAEAGYDGIELWVKDIESYLDNGGTIQKLRNAAENHGISVVNAIAFFKWSDEDDEIRKQGLKQAEREMSWLAELGCGAVAAPPCGNVRDVSLETIAVHFAELVELGRRIGVEPYLEFWGRAEKLSRLSEAIYIAIESEIRDAKILLDPFHMYTGGSNVDDLSYLTREHIGIVHVNDYPVSPSREHIADRDRVFPGDGIAPTQKIADYLNHCGYRGYVSLELFIEDFGSQTPLMVARHGLEKITESYFNLTKEK